MFGKLVQPVGPAAMAMREGRSASLIDGLFFF